MVPQKDYVFPWYKQVKEAISSLNIPWKTVFQEDWKTQMNKRWKEWENRKWKETCIEDNQLKFYPKTMLTGRARYIKQGKAHKTLTKFRIGDIPLIRTNETKKCQLCKTQIENILEHIFKKCGVIKKELQTLNINNDTNLSEWIGNLTIKDEKKLGRILTQIETESKKHLKDTGKRAQKKQKR